MIELSVDIEALGNKPTAVVQQIGWAVIDGGIDPDLEWPVLNQGNIFVDVDDCLSHGLTVNKSCLQWWFRQNKKVREAGSEEGVDLVTALRELNRVMGENPHQRMWVSAPSFDYAILENAYSAAGIVPNWNRKQQFCLRTLRQLTPWIERKDAKRFNRQMALQGIVDKHVAVNDAVRQALEISLRLLALRDRTT